ncbi:hypothetical protein AB0M43_15480 [Longispora sp. NPDC051575]|uniref:hypothetical protein n=1 Tax=Longispora sp. NPDC051575 TaxID=3154943 RepID=UPI00344AA5E9
MPLATIDLDNGFGNFVLILYMVGGLALIITSLLNTQSRGWQIGGSLAGLVVLLWAGFVFLFGGWIIISFYVAILPFLLAGSAIKAKFAQRKVNQNLHLLPPPVAPQGYPAPGFLPPAPGHPNQPGAPAGYAPQPGAPAGYAPQQGYGQPGQAQPGYPAQPGYAPQAQPGYAPQTPQGQPGYAPQGQPGHAPQPQQGYPAPQGYAPPGYAPPAQPGAVPPQQPGFVPSQAGYVPPQPPAQPAAHPPPAAPPQ